MRKVKAVWQAVWLIPIFLAFFLTVLFLGASDGPQAAKQFWKRNW